MWDINGILDQLERRKHMVSEKTFKQIANPEYYYPPCRSSFHDAWLINIDTRYGILENLLRRSFDQHDITMRLLGPYHDMVHTIHYLGVVSHQISIGEDAGDLLEHAFRIEDGHIVHEISFANANMRFVCTDVKISSEILAE